MSETAAMAGRDRYGAPPPSLEMLQRLIAPYERASNRRALRELATSLLPYGITWYLMYRSLSGPYWVTLLLAVPAAGFLIRIFIVQHDCGHGSFFTSARANRIVGRICSVFTLTPYGHWRRFHAMHHATSGKLDRRAMFDVETMTVAEYLASSATVRLRYRVQRHPVMLFGVLPVLYFVLLLRWPGVAPTGWTRERRSILLTDLAVVASFATLGSLVGPRALVLVQLPLTCIAATVGMWLFYVQHQFEDTYWDGDATWDYTRAALEGSSFYALPPVLAWFTGYIGHHHVHHLSTKVPSYRLLACVRENAELRDVPRLELRESFRCAGLALWDERLRRLVPFRAVPTSTTTTTTATATPTATATATAKEKSMLAGDSNSSSQSLVVERRDHLGVDGQADDAHGRRTAFGRANSQPPRTGVPRIQTSD